METPHNKSVLVTGAGTGLGLETALFLAERGFTVYAAVLDCSQQAHVEMHASRRLVRLRTVTLDVTDEATIAAAMGTIVDECGGIYGLVNNAGISLRGYFEDTDEAEIRRVFEVNVFGTMAVTRAALPHMRAARRGRVIFISSVGGRIASLARTAYCASKFGIEGLAEGLAPELELFGIQTSIIEPAIIKTERWTVNRGIARRALDPHSPYHDWFRAEERLADRLVANTPTKPPEVAKTVYQALTTKQPRLRYVVGKRARLTMALRRYTPGEWFDRVYFGAAVRMVTRGKTDDREKD